MRACCVGPPFQRAKPSAVVGSLKIPSPPGLVLFQKILLNASGIRPACEYFSRSRATAVAYALTLS